MKIFAVVLLIAAVAFYAFAQESNKAEISIKADAHIAAMKADGTLTNVLESLIAFGNVCELKGHHWRDGRPGEGNGAMFADYHPGVEFRTCLLCGKCQSHNTSLDWK